MHAIILILRKKLLDCSPAQYRHQHSVSSHANDIAKALQSEKPQNCTMSVAHLLGAIVYQTVAVGKLGQHQIRCTESNSAQQKLTDHKTGSVYNMYCKIICLKQLLYIIIGHYCHGLWCTAYKRPPVLCTRLFRPHNIFFRDNRLTD